MSLTSDERKSVVEFRIEKARRALEQAQGVVELQYWETIANRLYYAAYNAVSAMLIAYGYMAHSHDGVIHLFGQHFVKPGIGETTRVLLRRVPWKVLIRPEDMDNPMLSHLIRLAQEKNVPIETYPLQHYRTCGMIKKMADV